MKKIPNDHTMIQITLTLAVPNYLCDEHDTDDRAHHAAVDQIIDLVNMSSEATLLGYESTPLILTAGRS